MSENDQPMCEYFGDGAIRLLVWESRKEFAIEYSPAWLQLPLDKQKQIKDAMIRVTDYWWAKGFTDLAQQNQQEQPK